jgi:hypothetical protein
MAQRSKANIVSPRRRPAFALVGLGDRAVAEIEGARAGAAGAIGLRPGSVLKRKDCGDAGGPSSYSATSALRIAFASFFACFLASRAAAISSIVLTGSGSGRPNLFW